MSSFPALLPSGDEAQRLRSLRAHDVLNSLHEPVFDEFVAIAARIFSLPISLISLVEEDEVYYPANVGMLGHNSQPRQEAVCSVAIEHNQAVVVYEDLTLNENAIPAPAAQAARTNHVRFYAGASLRLPDQRRVGTLCVIDRRPRTFSEHEQRLLEQLAALVSQTMVVRYTCLALPDAQGQEQWQRVRAQLREELQALQALVRYLVTRYGAQIPVPTDVLTQVERRLHDLQSILTEFS